MLFWSMQQIADIPSWLRQGFRPRQPSEVLRTRGMTKGQFEDFRTGQVCAIGAYRASRMQDNRHWDFVAFRNWMDKFVEVARDQFPARMADCACLCGAHTVPAFNDHPDTSLDDVASIMEKIEVAEPASFSPWVTDDV